MEIESKLIQLIQKEVRKGRRHMGKLENRYQEGRQKPHLVGTR